VIRAGEVHYDQQGCFGESLDIAFRLLDAPEVKANLQQTKIPLSVVVSDTIYQSIVRHGYPGITEQTYKRAVHVHIAGRAHHGWLQQSATINDFAGSSNCQNSTKASPSTWPRSTSLQP
jgi:hypothetical protein